MRDEKIIRYEKPELAKYSFFGVNGVLTGATQDDIPEDCDDDFDE